MGQRSELAVCGVLEWPWLASALRTLFPVNAEKGWPPGDGGHSDSDLLYSGLGFGAESRWQLVFLHNEVPLTAKLNRTNFSCQRVLGQET